MDSNLVIEKKREFGEIISDGFTFIKENFSVLLKTYLIYIMPFMIMVGYSYSHVMTSIWGSIGDSTVLQGKEGVFFLCMFISSLIGYLILYVTGFGAIILKGKGNVELTFEDIKAYIGKHFITALVGFLMMYAILILISICMVLPMVIHPGLGVITVFGGIFFLFYAMIRWSFCVVFMIDEGVGFGEGLKKSAQLVEGNWWSTFGILIVSSIIVSLVGQVVSIPLLLIGGFSAFSNIEVATDVTETTFLSSLTAILTFGITGFFQFYTVVCIMLKYVDLKVKKYGSQNLQDEIANFGDDDKGIFENEGEY